MGMLLTVYSVRYAVMFTLNFNTSSGLPVWHRGNGLDCGSGDLGSIPGIPSPRVGPLMARMLKTSLDVPVPVSG